MEPIKKSKGHLIFKDDFEYIQVGTIIYRVSVKAHFHSNEEMKGYRVGATFYCTTSAWRQSPLLGYSNDHAYADLPGCCGPV